MNLADPITRPVLSRLHPVLQLPEDPNDPVADWITAFVDEYAAWITNRAREFAVNYCDPGRCPDDALDWLAGIIAGDFYWDSKWLPIQKRRILVNAVWLRSSRGSARIFRWMISNFDLQATFEPIGGWIVGIPAVASPLSADLSGSPFDWRISIPDAYQDSTPEYALVVALRNDWLPVWVSVRLNRGGVDIREV